MSKKPFTVYRLPFTKRTGFTPLEKVCRGGNKGSNQSRFSGDERGSLTGFTLVEIMIVVTIMGILAAIVAPYYVRAREEAKAKACICTLKEIEGAKERWAISMDVDRWAVPEWTELVPDFLKNEPRCPAGGTYAIGDSHTIPTCDIGSNETAEKYDDHILYN